MNVYKGDQTFDEFLILSRQGRLFESPAVDPHTVTSRLAVIAARVVADLGRDASWVDLKDTLKSRAAGKVIYDSSLAVIALEAALRLRGQATT